MRSAAFVLVCADEFRFRRTRLIFWTKPNVDTYSCSYMCMGVSFGMFASVIVEQCMIQIDISVERQTGDSCNRDLV